MEIGEGPVLCDDVVAAFHVKLLDQISIGVVLALHVTKDFSFVLWVDGADSVRL